MLERPPSPGARTGSLRLRVPGRGRLGHLQSQYEAGLRPAPARWSATGEKESQLDLLLQHGLRREHHRTAAGRREPTDLAHYLQLSLALPQCSHAELSPATAEWVSGHTPDGAPSQQSHLAIFPLAHVDHEHADGRLLGLASRCPRASRRRSRPLSGNHHRRNDSANPTDSPLRRCGLRVACGSRSGEGRPTTLQPEIWTAAHPAEPCDRWVTVTLSCWTAIPKPRRWRADGRDACGRVGLPRPVDVILTPVSLFIGVPPAGSFPAFSPTTGQPRRLHTHAIIRFAEPVRGPILLGAGRYRGYGLCRPWRRKGVQP